MELNEINSASMTDKIVESISRTKGESVEELYEEYMYDDDYEEYGFRCQECGQEGSPLLHPMVSSFLMWLQPKGKNALHPKVHFIPSMH